MVRDCYYGGGGCRHADNFRKINLRLVIRLNSGERQGKKNIVLSDHRGGGYFLRPLYNRVARSANRVSKEGERIDSLSQPV